MKSVNIGIIGAGTVGGGVVDLIRRNGSLIEKRTGVRLRIKKVCDISKDALRRLPRVGGLVKTSDASSILNDREIDIVVELIGGVNPARKIILAAFAKKKHVVTANKALLSARWKEVLSAAARNKVFIGFEASVGGAIPIIRSIRESFVSNRLDVIYGILNGTTNFILTMMKEGDVPFEEALAMAKDKRLAERDPSLDISGKDTAQKLAILSLLGFGVEVDVDRIYTEGIENIAGQDLRYAKEWGYEIKLLAIAKASGGKLELRVHPTLLPSQHILASVSGEDNAVFLKGDFMGESLLYGLGAGREPAASSVVSDVVEIARHIAFHGREILLHEKLIYNRGSLKYVGMENLLMPYYFRFSVIDRPGVLAAISSVLAKNKISIATMSQEEIKKGRAVPVTMLTHFAKESSMRKAISQIDRMKFVTAKTVVIRMEP